MTTKVLLYPLLLSLFLVGEAAAQEISEKNIRKHLEYLASDKLKGRGTSTKEEKKASAYIAKQFRKIGLQPKGDNGTWYHQFGYKKSKDPHGTDLETAPQMYSRNVVGYIDNGAAHTIVIGGHYDHLGLGLDRNSLETNPQGKIHNGADDNASGTAGVIELARYYAKNGIKEQHNFLFLCFSAEELGLYGSKKYVEYPTIDLATVSFMVNMDMIGRMNQENRIMVGGVGTAPDFVPLLEKLKSSDLTFKLDSSGVGASDHTSFYLKNIPVLFFFTGQHSDYHRPSDDTDKINYPGEVKVLQLVTRVIEQLDKSPKLTFQETRSKVENAPRFKVTLGIMPDYTYEGEGVRADGVNDGRPGAKAGMQKGDIIVELGDMKIKTMSDYMKALSLFQKGDSTKIKVKRMEAEKVLEVTF